MKKVLLVLGILVLLFGAVGCTQRTVTPNQGTTPSDQEPSEYGTPPGGPKPPEIEVPEGYPYFAKIPQGLEGKVELAYNYAVDPSGYCSVKMKFTNLSDRTVESYQVSEFARDKNGKVIELGGCGSSVIKPGKSVDGGMTGSLDWESLGLTPPIEIFLEVTYLKFE